MNLAKRAFIVLVCTLGLICAITGCTSTKETQPQINSSDTISYEPSTPITKEPTKKEITITLDNWNTYFEFVEKEEEHKNDYNETDYIKHYYSFDLKDKYVLDEVDIKIDYSYIDTLYEVKEDLTNRKIIWGEIIEGPIEKTQEVNIRYDERKIAGQNFGNYKSKCTDFKVHRIYGTLIIFE